MKYIKKFETLAEYNQYMSGATPGQTLTAKIDELPQDSDIVFDKLVPHMTYSNIGIADQGEDTFTVTVSLQRDATGSLTFSNGVSSETKQLVSGSASFIFVSSPGDHQFTVQYSGDNNYLADTETPMLTIPKYSTETDIELSDISVEDDFITTICISSVNADGVVNIKIDNSTYSGITSNGKIDFVISGLSAGEKTIIAEYEGNNNYLPSSAIGLFEVFKLNTTIGVSAETDGSEATIRIDANIKTSEEEEHYPYTRSYVRLNLNGFPYYTSITDGEGRFDFDLDEGEYEVQVYFDGSSMSLPASGETTFTIVQ